MTKLGLVAAAALSLFSGSAYANPMTYTIVPVTAVTVPATVSGTITTDGKVGSLYNADILDWNLTFSGVGNPITLTASNSKVFGIEPPGPFDHLYLLSSRQDSA